MLLKQYTKARTVSIFDPEHQFRVKIQNCRSRAYIGVNPFGHSKVAIGPEIFVFGALVYSTFRERSIRLRMASWGEVPECNI
jgi:hypothetical protein